MKTLLLALAIVVMIFAATISADEKCVEPAALVRSTVRITKHLTEEQKKLKPGLTNVYGTAWFFESARYLATIAHVAEYSFLSMTAWSEVEISQHWQEGALERSERMLVRLLALLPTPTESIAVLELESPFIGAQILPIRATPLISGEAVMSIAYTKGHLRFASGRFIGIGDGLYPYKAFKAFAMFEMSDDYDRYALDEGASGAAILDCQGRAAAIVSAIATQPLGIELPAYLAGQEVRITMPWGNANNAGVLTIPLKGFTPDTK